MKKGWKIGTYIVVVLSIVISFFLDKIVSSNIILLHNPILDNFFMLITKISSEVILFIVLTAILLWNAKKRRWILPLWLCLGVSSAVSFILKITIHRLRPFQIGLISMLPGLIEESHSIWNFSFPSSHSMLAFCAIPILSEQFPKLKKGLILFATLIAFSRVYFGFHFLSDILVGALIGYGIGLIIVRKEKEYSFSKKIYNKVFKK